MNKEELAENLKTFNREHPVRGKSKKIRLDTEELAMAHTAPSPGSERCISPERDPGSPHERTVLYCTNAVVVPNVRTKFEKNAVFLTSKNKNVTYNILEGIKF